MQLHLQVIPSLQQDSDKQKKDIFEEDVEAIISGEVQNVPSVYTLKHLRVESGIDITPSATIELDINGRRRKHAGTGDGPIDAVYRTITAMVKTTSTLTSYSVKAITGGMDAQGEVMVNVASDGRTVTGHGASTDIIVASAMAYLNALNKLAYWKGKTFHDLRSAV